MFFSLVFRMPLRSCTSDQPSFPMLRLTFLEPPTSSQCWTIRFLRAFDIIPCSPGNMCLSSGINRDSDILINMIYPKKTHTLWLIKIDLCHFTLLKRSGCEADYKVIDPFTPDSLHDVNWLSSTGLKCLHFSI